MTTSTDTGRARYLLEFRVEGLPATQGSKTPLGAGRFKEASVGLAAWRHAVTIEASRAMARMRIREPFDGPLLCAVVFRFPMPKSRPADVRDAGIAPKSTMPDLDKLQRAVGDSLTDARLIVDDARIVQWKPVKYEVTDWIGAIVRLRPWTASEADVDTNPVWSLDA